jgi:hypothetical protein
MRLALVFLLLFDAPDSIERAWPIIAIACLGVGFYGGRWVASLAAVCAFEAHVEKHFFQVGPAPGCYFCKIERGLR